MRRIRDRVFGPEGDPHRWVEALNRAAIPARYRAATVEAIPNAQLQDWVRRTIDSPEDWLGKGLGFLLAGHLNSGKSSIAGILIMDAIRRCEQALWLAVRQVPGVIFRDGERNSALNDRLYEADILVLDDLGAEGYSMEKGGGAALEGALRMVYDAGRSVVVTSNLGAEQIRTHYPEPVVSVLQRTTSLVVVEGEWSDGPGKADI